MALGVRERCDSLPSARQGPGEALGAAPGVPGAGLGGVLGGPRPHSMYSRGLSHSPPTGIANSPLSPHSGKDNIILCNEAQLIFSDIRYHIIQLN